MVVVAVVDGVVVGVVAGESFLANLEGGVVEKKLVMRFCFFGDSETECLPLILRFLCDFGVVDVVAVVDAVIIVDVVVLDVLVACDSAVLLGELVVELGPTEKKCLFLFRWVKVIIQHRKLYE